MRRKAGHLFVLNQSAIDSVVDEGAVEICGKGFRCLGNRRIAAFPLHIKLGCVHGGQRRYARQKNLKTPLPAAE